MHLQYQYQILILLCILTDTEILFQPIKYIILHLLIKNRFVNIEDIQNGPEN